ncbi:unnamed protein product, partial [Adineta steineri]
MAASYLHQSTNEIEYVKIFISIIMLATGEFHTVEQADELFIVKEFLKHKDNHLLSERLYFVVNSAIIPEYQGKKLAKSLVSAVLKK